jgi:hypothetical protein
MLPPSEVMSSGSEIASRPLGVVWKIPLPEANTLLFRRDEPLVMF